MSNSGLLLDTHVWVRFGNKSPLLRKSTIESIDQGLTSGTVFVSVISVWEVAMLVRDGRLAIHSGLERWVEEALSLPGLQLLSFSTQIAIQSVTLPESMHKDPADRILVASAQVERLALVTADKAMLKFAKTTGLSHMRA
jgi:PIN domain nuclease of toxin-antitoxin system